MDRAPGRAGAYVTTVTFACGPSAYDILRQVRTRTWRNQPKAAWVVAADDEYACRQRIEENDEFEQPAVSAGAQRASCRRWSSSAILIVAFAIFTSFWTDRLWYRSFDFGSVFTTLLLTRIGLFVAFGLIMATLVVGNAAIAYRMRPQLSAPVPEQPAAGALPRAAGVPVRLGRGRRSVSWSACSPAAPRAARCWNYLAWRNAHPVRGHRPQFGLDVGFFVFSYPWWRFVASFVFTALVFSAIVAAHRALHRRGAAVQRTAPGRQPRGPGAPVDPGRPRRAGQGRRATGSTSTGWRSSSTNRLFTGINYTADNATVNAKLILAVIAGICALLFFANAVLRRWMVPTIGLTLLLLSAIVLGIVYPGRGAVLQRPARRAGQGAAATSQRNIDATRAAYGVDKVEITDYSAKTTATAGQLRSDAEALPGIRLIDPNVVSPAFEQLQQVRGYYTFPKTLDVDRYTIDGKETDAVVAVREMDLERRRGPELEQPARPSTPTATAWSPRTATGASPVVNRSGSPRTSRPTGMIEEHEPRIYFGEMQGQRPTVLHRRRSRLARRPSSWIPLVAAKAATRRPTPTPARAASTSAACGIGCCTPPSSPTSTSCSQTA